jgi:putative SOS response-associated peptidase YedK
MCGRIASFTPPEQLAKRLGAQLADGLDPVGHPSWNVTPMRRVYALAGPAANWIIDAYRWGLVPPWSQDPSVGNRLFNARAETVSTAPAFRSAFARRRLAVIADGFYEWREARASEIVYGSGRKVPYAFLRFDGDLLLLAGLFETWRDPDEPENPAKLLRTCTIITTNANADVAEVHDRMPVVLSRESAAAWTDPSAHAASELLDLLRPAPPGTLVSYQVHPDVSSVSNDGERLFRPLRPDS